MSGSAGITDLRCEYRVNPIGIGETAPRLNWRLEDDRRGARQTAYRLLVASSPERLTAGEGDVWDSGKVASDQSVHTAYAGPALEQRRRYGWKVQLWDAEGKPTSWSAPAFWEMALLDRAAWTGKWISIPPRDAWPNQPCPYLRRTFAITADVKRARLYATARGLFEISLNGRRVGADFFVPGWTNFAKRNQVLTYDVTDLLARGANAIGAVLGDGWYCGRIVKSFVEEQPIPRVPQLLAQLEIETADGRTLTIPTDETWQSATGPILASDIYDGESYDARCEMPGWATAAFDASTWQPAAVYEDWNETLDPKISEPVRAVQELKPLSVKEPRPGVFVYDLGQNMVGWARLKVRAEAGRTVTLRFAEMLNADGTLYTENLRSARATDTYVCRGGREELWEPRFTFHGFRYVELTGLDARPGLDAITGVVLHNDMQPTGLFQTSHPRLNQLQHNITWGQKSNFLEVPTDCPQRDERLGWTGDAQVFVPTASFNYNVAPFFTKWQHDLADDQGPTGAIPSYSPSRHPTNDAERDGGPAWADAVVICPWTIYQSFGDERILARHYDEMRAFVGFMERKAANLIRADEHYVERGGYGDWVAMDAPFNDRVGATPKDLIGTAYFARVTSLVAAAARLLGKAGGAAELDALHDRIVAAFRREFVTASGRLVGNTQTAYVLALAFDLLAEDMRQGAVERLVRMLERRKWRLSTGFVGTPLLCPVLARFGRSDIAYKLLLQEEYPSWLYTVNQGATTMWERWNSYTKQDGFGDAGMNSFNHYAYGAIGAWMYSAVAGLATDPDAPGYKRLLIAPVIGEGLTSAEARLQTLYGEARSAWSLAGGVMTLAVTVPPNTTAAVTLPGAKIEAVEESKTALAEAAGISEVEPEDGRVRLKAGAGKYAFAWPWEG